jgi:predicted nuclease of predicted toxin-antitoxin system
MIGLFVELYLDEDVDPLVAKLLRTHGFSATTALEAGQLHKDDREQLAYAVNQRKTLLTHNRADFEALALSYFAEGRCTSGSSLQFVAHHMRSSNDCLLF